MIGLARFGGSLHMAILLSLSYLIVKKCQMLADKITLIVEERHEEEYLLEIKNDNNKVSK